MSRTKTRRQIASVFAEYVDGELKLSVRYGAEGYQQMGTPSRINEELSNHSRRDPHQMVIELQKFLRHNCMMSVSRIK